MEVQNQVLRRHSWRLCPLLLPLSLYFLSQECRAAFEFFSCGGFIIWPFLYLRRLAHIISTKNSYFRFPSPLASIRAFKPVHPTRACSYSFSALPSSLQYWALNLEPSLLCGLCSLRLLCLRVGTYQIQSVLKPVSQCESAGGRAWGTAGQPWEQPHY